MLKFIMKKIIILEGIATSGKTTLKEKLALYFIDTGHKTEIVSEDETLMPILHNTEKIASLKLLNEVLKKTLETEADIIIFDRLYFTHLFRTKSSLADFSSIENLLSQHQSLTVLLTIEKTAIKERIFKAMQHRDTEWTEFVKKKGTDDEIVKYYQDQQDKLLELTKESKLPSLILDMTDNDYDGAMRKIIDC